MSMKKFIAAGLASIGIAALASMPALAASDKGTMYDHPSGSCATGATGGSAAGFANLNEVGGNISGPVSLKGANPNTIYTVQLWDQNCSAFYTGTLITNGQGNGTLYVPATAMPATPEWFAAAFNSTTGDFLASAAVQ